MAKQSTGDYRVGRSFNPSGNPLVDEIKQRTAELIDLIKSAEPDPPDLAQNVRYNAEFNRRKAHAMTLLNDACMNAVGAVTLQPPVA